MAKECSNSSCNKSSCEGCGQKQPQSLMAEPNVFSDVKHVIGVVSGKGGVGKSFVTGSLANLMASKGYKVGIMDADITGPSIPKMYGIKGNAQGSDNGIYPMPTANGIEVMSVNLLLPDEETPVIWRGPVLANMVKQFWTDVVWDKIDYLFVDMPPGTGDVPLTVFQSLPVDGIVIVTSPQELVSMIVEKAVKMAKLMNIPIIGIIENMSYFECPDCGKRHNIYGESHIEEIAAQYNIPVLAKLPICTELAKQCDQGTVELFEGDWLNEAVNKISNI